MCIRATEVVDIKAGGKAQEFLLSNHCPNYVFFHSGSLQLKWIPSGINYLDLIYKEAARNYVTFLIPQISLIKPTLVL